MGPGKPGKSWNFTVAFFSSGKCWKLKNEKFEMYGR